MFGVYVFFAIIGIPLLAILAIGGGDVEGELGVGLDADFDADVGADFDVSGADGSFADFAAFKRIPISSYVSFMAFFGGVGVISSLVGIGAITTFILAVVLGVVSAGINTALFGYLRNSESDSSLGDRQLEGRIATVSVPIEAGKRGRVTIDTGGERLQITAGSVESMPDMGFARGDEVVIIKVDEGIAQVMAVDPDLH